MYLIAFLFTVGLLLTKPEIRRIFTEEELIKLFAYIDISSAQRITLFEFVKCIRVRFIHVFLSEILFFLSKCILFQLNRRLFLDLTFEVY
jgi:hypothetical protein